MSTPFARPSPFENRESMETVWKKTTAIDKEVLESEMTTVDTGHPLPHTCAVDVLKKEERRMPLPPGADPNADWICMPTSFGSSGEDLFKPFWYRYDPDNQSKQEN